MTKISIKTPGSGGSTSPGGANTNVQYNDGGNFGGDALFVFDETNTRLGVGVTTPDTTLNIEGPDQCVARFESTGVGGGIDLKDQSTTSNNYVGVGALGDNLCFRAGGVAQGLARLFSTGNLVVGSSLTDNGFQIETEDRDASFNGVRVGRGAGNISTNTAVGASALNVNTTGANNVAVGSSALIANTTGGTNVAIGREAMASNTTGSQNFGLGFNALALNSTGSSNIAIGIYSLFNNTSSNNTAIGSEAGRFNTSGTGLTAIGYQALRASTGNNNTALGFQAGLAVSTGTSNTLIGNRSGSSITSGIQNTSVGDSALAAIVGGSGNVAIGRESMRDQSSGEWNVALGANCLQTNTTGASNTVVGAQANSGNFSGSVILGRSATATANNQFVVGSATYNAGTVTVGAAAQTHYWTIKINGTDYKVLLAL